MLAFFLTLSPSFAAEKETCEARLASLTEEVQLSFLEAEALPRAAAAAPQDQDQLSAEAANQRQARLDGIVHEFHRLGLYHLTASYDRGQTIAVFYKRALPWHRDISVRWGTPEKKILIRSLDWADTQERNQAALALARALYKLEGGTGSDKSKPATQLDAELALAEKHFGPPEPKRSFLLRSAWSAALAAQLLWIAPTAAPDFTNGVLEKVGLRESAEAIELPDPVENARDAQNQPVPLGAQINLMLQKVTLERMLVAEKDKVYPNVAEIDKLRAEYARLLERYPFLAEVMPVTKNAAY